MAITHTLQEGGTPLAPTSFSTAAELDQPTGQTTILEFLILGCASGCFSQDTMEPSRHLVAELICHPFSLWKKGPQKFSSVDKM